MRVLLPNSLLFRRKNCLRTRSLPSKKRGRRRRADLRGNPGEGNKKIWKRFDFRKKIKFTEENKKEFEEATSCWICGDEFLPSEKKLRDHCHFTGRFREAAHSNCNLQFQKPKFTPVFFHNLSGYDSHLFVKNLGKTSGEIRAIANKEQKYISFSKKVVVGNYFDEKGKEKLIYHEIRFVDSYKFMSFPLADLVKNLSPERFVFTKRAFGKKWEMMSRKGVYPYDWMDSFDKFEQFFSPPKGGILLPTLWRGYF